MPTITAASLKSAVYSRVENNTRAYTSQEVLNGINEAVSILNLFTGWMQVSIEVGPTVQNRTIYDCPERIIYPTRVFLDGRVLTKVQLTDLLNKSPNAILDTTAAQFSGVEKWSPIGISKIMIYPGDSVGGKSLQINGVVEPEKMTNDTDVLELPNEAMPAIADYAAHIIQLKLGGMPFNQSQAFFMAFQGFLKQRTIWKNLDFPAWQIERQQSQAAT